MYMNFSSTYSIKCLFFGLDAEVTSGEEKYTVLQFLALQDKPFLLSIDDKDNYEHIVTKLIEDVSF